MAFSDYYCCDVCGAKAFYDANLNYDFDSAPSVEYGCNRKLDYVGDMAVICDECSKTHKVEVVATPPAQATAAPTQGNLRNIISNAICGYGSAVEDHAGIVDAVAKAVAPLITIQPENPACGLGCVALCDICEVAEPPATAAPTDLSAAIMALADHVADNWPMRKYTLAEIETMLRAITPAALASQPSAVPKCDDGAMCGAGGYCATRPNSEWAKPSAVLQAAVDPNVFFDALADFKDTPQDAADGQRFFDALSPAVPQAVAVPEELRNAFITLESDGENSRTIVLKFNQRAGAYAVHEFLVRAAKGGAA